MTSNADEQIPKPTPVRDEGTAEFFDAAKKDQLMVRRCRLCRAYTLVTSRYCPSCLGDGLEWVQADGTGHLHTYALVHQKSHPAFAAEIPYPVGIVRLDEGPMLNARLVGFDRADLEVGMPVQVAFLHADGKESTPILVPAAESDEARTRSAGRYRSESSGN